MPQFDRTREQYVIRWRDENGARRANSTFATKEAALAFRAELMGQPKRDEQPKRTAVPADPPAAPADGAGSAAWWTKLHTYLASELIKATRERAEQDVDLLAKTIRAFAALAQSQAQHRDLEGLEDELEKLRAWQADVMSAATHGTRISTETSRESAAGETVRREDSIH